MIESLLRHQSNSEIWVLCLSDQCQNYLEELGHKSIHPCSLSELESSYPELLEAKENRNLSEYYFTLSPFFPDWVLKQEPEIDSITYLDSDLEFYYSPEKILEELKDYSIGIIEHRFHPSYDHSRYAGRFNVGWIFLKMTKRQKKCLSQWMSQCSEWCKDQPEDGKFADQMYLNSWPDDFKNARIIDHPGANLAPWNLNTHKLTLNQSSLTTVHKSSFITFICSGSLMKIMFPLHLEFTGFPKS